MLTFTTATPTKKKIKVLHVGDKFGCAGSTIHGVTRLFSWWIPRYNKDIFEVKLVGLRPPDDASRALEELGIPVISLNKSKFDFSTVLAIRNLALKEKADILHLHGYSSTNFGLLAAKLLNVKTVVHEHFVDPNYPLYQRPFDFALARSADYAFGVSKSVVFFMVKERYFRGNKTHLLYNGAPLEYFKEFSDSQKKEERAKWGVLEHDTVLLAVGRVDIQKGFLFFIEGLPKIVKYFPNTKALIVGDGPCIEECKTLAQNLGLGKHVTFTGYHNNVPLIQSIADLQVFPSLWEGTPLALIEAMAMRLPIVATNVDGIGEILEGNNGGILIPPKDSEALANNINELLMNPDRAQHLASIAHKRSSQFEIQNSVNEMERVYHHILGNS